MNVFAFRLMNIAVILCATTVAFASPSKNFVLIVDGSALDVDRIEGFKSKACLLTSFPTNTQVSLREYFGLNDFRPNSSLINVEATSKTFDFSANAPLLSGSLIGSLEGEAFVTGQSTSSEKGLRRLIRDFATYTGETFVYRLTNSSGFSSRVAESLRSWVSRISKENPNLNISLLGLSQSTKKTFSINLRQLILDAGFKMPLNDQDPLSVSFIPFGNPAVALIRTQGGTENWLARLVSMMPGIELTYIKGKSSTIETKRLTIFGHNGGTAEVSYDENSQSATYRLVAGVDPLKDHQESTLLRMIQGAFSTFKNPADIVAVASTGYSIEASSKAADSTNLGLYGRSACGSFWSNSKVIPPSLSIKTAAQISQIDFAKRAQENGFFLKANSILVDKTGPLESRTNTVRDVFLSTNKRIVRILSKTFELFTTAIKDNANLYVGEVPKVRQAVLTAKHEVAKTDQLIEETAGFIIHDGYNFAKGMVGAKRFEDTRDLRVASTWRTTKQVDPKDLFKEIYKEKQLKFRYANYFPINSFAEFYPTPDTDVTFVVIGGIHGDIFYNEIWQRSVQYCNDQLGLRCMLIAPNGRGGCRENALEDILNPLKKEAARQKRLGKNAKFVLIGYSKGSLDSLYLFKERPDFIKEHVLALVAMASPLRGAQSSVQMGVPLPTLIAEPMVNDNRPDVVAEKAVDDVDPVHWTDKAFWNDFAVPDGVKLFSLSFVSPLYRTHVFLMASHILAKEKTDGAVTVTESQFPSFIPSVHFGQISANHLVALPDDEMQDDRPILDSVITVLGEYGVFNNVSK